MNTVAVCRRQGENQGNVNIIPFVIYNAYRNKSDEITFLSFSHSLQAHVGAFYYNFVNIGEILPCLFPKKKGKKSRFV